MADIRFTDALGAGVDMRGIAVFYDDVTRSTPSILRFAEGDWTITYTGVMAHDGGDVTGALEKLVARRDGDVVVVAEGLDVDAGALWGFAETGNARGALRLLIAGDDAITGSRFADALLGGDGRDSIRGLGGDDSIDGGVGADRLRGGGGADSLFGGSGGDRLYGDVGDDRLYGGDGRDLLYGGAGRNALFGGDGADDFVFTRMQDFGLGADRKVSLIGDFSRAEGDRIDLGALDADMMAAGLQTFRFIGRADFSGEAGQLRFENGMASADVHGDGEADFFIEVADVPRLFASDFVL